MRKKLYENIKIINVLNKIKQNTCAKILFKDISMVDKIFELYDFKSVSNLKDCHIFSNIKKHDGLDIYENNKYFNRFSKISIPITVNIFIFSLSIQTESSKIENRLLKNKYKDILILISDWASLSIDTQSFIIELMKNRKWFLKKYSKSSITILYCTTENNNKLDNGLFDCVINFPELNIDELFDITVSYPEFNNLSFQKFEEIYQINAGDYSNTIAMLKMTKDCGYSFGNETLETCLDSLIKIIDEKMNFRNVSNNEVLKLFALFPDYFDPFEVANIDIRIDKFELEENIRILETLFVFSKHKFNENLYIMLLQLKNKLMNSSKVLIRELLALYYQYLTEFYPLDYRRKLDVQFNYLNDEQEILIQYILLYDYYFVNKLYSNSQCLIDEVKKTNISSTAKELFINICEFKYSKPFQSMFKKYGCKNKKLNAFLLKKDIEYYAAYGENYEELRELCNILYELITTERCLENDFFTKGMYLMVLIPQYIDKFNDLRRTNTLVEIFNAMSSRSNVVNEHIVYYKNILKRKSYLFKNTTISIYRCKEALNYFKSKPDEIEVYFTLNTLLSLYIMNDDLESANNCKTEILSLKKSLLPQFYKTDMNFILLDIFSETIDSDVAIRRYLEILNRNVTLTTKNIIFVNVCAISLENDDLGTYEKYKKEFEDENNITDVSNVQDKSVDDFYRYYFAWFEFGKNMLIGNKENAKSIYQSLSNFIPSIFKGEESVLNSKYDFYKSILDKDVSAGKDFSNFALNKKNNYRNWKFFGRGFMLTDIEHTSII